MLNDNCNNTYTCYKKNYGSAYASIEITINYPVFQKTYSSTYLTLKLRNCTQLSTT